MKSKKTPEEPTNNRNRNSIEQSLRKGQNTAKNKLKAGIQLLPSKGIRISQQQNIHQELASPTYLSSNLSLISCRRLRKKLQTRESSNKVPPTQNFLPTPRKRLGDSGQMRKLVHITEIVKLFLQKLNYTSVLRKPVSYDPLENKQRIAAQKSCRQERLHLPKQLENILLVTKIIYIIIYCFAFPLALIFTVIEYSDLIFVLKLIGCCLCLLDILHEAQEPRERDIADHLETSQFKKIMIDRRWVLFSNILILIATIFSIILTANDLRLGIFMFVGMAFKLKYYLRLIIILEDQFSGVIHYQKYWDLVKVIAINMLVCHVLACLLISASYLNREMNWMINANITQAPWYEQYIWSYYFGTTIVLTIGFGDLHPSNYIEAFFIILISFFSCVFFGYNLTYIGNIINSIRQDQLEKNEKLKIFGSLAKKTNISQDIQAEIKNYIVEEAKIKKISNFGQEKKLLKGLPQSLRSSFLHQANQHLFNNFLQLIRFTTKTIENLSLSIQTKICHRGQMIKRAKSQPNLIILQSGDVGFFARRIGAKLLNNTIIQKLGNTLQQTPKLICVDLLSKELLNYDIKSLSSSIISEMSKQNFEKCISQQKDYENYRELLDKCRYKANQFGLVQCRFCKNKMHSLFQCPRLHFMPFHSVIPLKYCKKNEGQKQERIKFNRIKKESYFQFASDFFQTKQLTGPFKEIGHVNPLKNIDERPHKRSTANKKRSSYYLTFEMVTQLREDIRNIGNVSHPEKFEFNLWDNTDCDQAFNFSHYFPKCNSEELSHRQVKTNIMNLTNMIKRKRKITVDQ